MDDQEVNTIRSQFQAGLWPQFLQMVQIDGLRGWSGQAVELNFPVVAVVGENGSGKSTLLKVAACVYDNDDKEKRFYPSAFFVETVWDKIQGVRIEYRVKLGPNVETLRNHQAYAALAGSRQGTQTERLPVGYRSHASTRCFRRLC